MDSDRITIALLSLDCRAPREHVKRWVMDGGYDPANLRPEDYDDLVKLIQSHQTGKGGAKTPQRDKDGLTWLESKQKEEQRKLKRENDIAEKALTETWMLTTAHHQILSNYSSALETVPDKIRTELGLSVAQRDRVQKILDAARFDAAAETRRMLEEGKKRVQREAEAK